MLRYNFPETIFAFAERSSFGIVILVNFVFITNLKTMVQQGFGRVYVSNFMCVLVPIHNIGVGFLTPITTKKNE